MVEDTHDIEQNRRIRDLEARVSALDIQLAAIIAKLDTLTSIGKALAILAGTAIGVDVIPLLGGV